jgi:Uma2 family endonuclease
MHARIRPTLYEQLEALPDGLIGEILDGQLHTRPRPTPRHLRAASRLDRIIGRHFDDGDDGPGGWWIFPGPELHFIRDTEVDVPDLAGWRRERMPQPQEGHRFTIVPDWICEVLSKSTESTDREIKMPIYARFGVAYAWLVDPAKRTLEVYALEEGAWREIGLYRRDQQVSAPPFEAERLRLSDLWMPE